MQTARRMASSRRSAGRPAGPQTRATPRRLGPTPAPHRPSPERTAPPRPPAATRQARLGGRRGWAARLCSAANRLALACPARVCALSPQQLRTEAPSGRARRLQQQHRRAQARSAGRRALSPGGQLRRLPALPRRAPHSGVTWRRRLGAAEQRTARARRPAAGMRPCQRSGSRGASVRGAVRWPGRSRLAPTERSLRQVLASRAPTVQAAMQPRATGHPAHTAPQRTAPTSASCASGMSADPRQPTSVRHRSRSAPFCCFRTWQSGRRARCMVPTAGQ